jgi:hypothetical protein
MRARVLITDGSRTIDLYWVEHTGSDVYCGMTNVDGKRSYHASGKIHSTREGKRDHEGYHAPLSELMGQFNLTSVTLGNAREFVRVAAPRHEYSGRKSDTVLTIDARSVPEDAQTVISIGLLEPGNGKTMAWLTSFELPFEGEELLPQQALFATSVHPWVYAIVYWWRKKPANSTAESARAKAARAARRER